MPYDFPSNPTNGQVYANFVYDSSITSWRNVNTDTGIGTLNAMGLKNVVPTSVAVSDGSATVNSNGTVTFSNSSVITPNGIFGSGYKNYRIIGNIDSVSGNGVVELRIGTSGNASGYYYGGLQAIMNGTNTAAYGVGVASWQIGYAYNAGNNKNTFVVDIFNPFLPVRTQISSNYMGGDSSDNFAGRTIWGTHTGNTSYTGIALFAAAGTNTLTGSMQIYGYNN